MTFFHALILGIVEGITEFLPISSTGHMILVDKLMHMPQTEFLKTFEISIQLGAILSVIVVYWKSLLIRFDVLKRVIAAFIPTAVIGLLMYKTVKHLFLGNSDIVLSSLFIGGLVLIIFDSKNKEKFSDVDDIASISYKKAICIGLFQSIAMIPGVSRSAATIIGGLALRIKRKTIVEFSFLLAIPTMAAATGLDLLKTKTSITSDQWGLLAVGFIVSFFVALASIKFLLYYVKKHNFVIFGFYRILIAVGLLLFNFIKK